MDYSDKLCHLSEAEHMNECPDCDEPMLTFELDAIEIDRCETCKGTWLDAGELEYIAEMAGAEQGKLHEALERTKEGKVTRRRCPRCGKKLREIEIQGKGETIVLDKCPRGHGIFFDKGEILKVVSSFSHGGEGAVARFFSELLKSELE